MSAINRVLLVGNITRDFSVKYTPGGNAVVEFSIAINGREKGSDGEWGDRVDYFDVTVWGNQAEACGQYLKKGSKVAIDGRLRQDRWETKDDPPKKRSAVRITADNVQFLDSRQRDDDHPGASTDETKLDHAGSHPGPSDDDIPF